MQKLFITLLYIQFSLISFSQDHSWEPVAGKLKTEWTDKVNPQSVLNEYPRPQLKRQDWTNLNGLWDYSIQPYSENLTLPGIYDGKILVPFAIESSLSGVGKQVGKDNVLWYHKTIQVSKNLKGKRILLHFGAVDWQTELFVNKVKAGIHKGGYDPFEFDITDLLKKGEDQEIDLKVWDPADEGPQPRGKQVSKPHGIWYTPVTGIWQTVWLEVVPETYIKDLHEVPDIDNNSVFITVDVENFKSESDQIMISAWKDNEKLAERSALPGQKTDLQITNPQLWSPSNPFLYELKISVFRKGKLIDEATSYFAMRKISMAKDHRGIQRMLLNDHFLFQYGPLDQGWWPDGLYTAPTDEALRFDILKTKEMGFNMIRKHVKVEPARWYYHCDQLGMLVWQDMPSGDLGNRWESRPGIVGKATDKERTEESELIYKTEWNAIMESLMNFPCIVVWVPFNEAWGQFKTKEIVLFTAQKDPSRLINPASGGNFENTGDILDIHNYPEPVMPDPGLYGSTRILVLGEFGGLGLPVENHTWQEKDNWGYQSFKNNDDLFVRYNEFIDRIPSLIDRGLSAAVYTQTTDVEIETNGLMTYDRKLIKMPLDKLKSIHKKLYEQPVQ